MNVDLTGNADTEVFLKMLKHASFLHFAERKRKTLDMQTIGCFSLILFSEMSVYIYKTDADVEPNSKHL